MGKETVQAAKSEGKLIFAIAAGNEPRRGLSETFKSSYGIDSEGVVGTVGPLVAKILAERRAGLYLWDVLIGGSGGQISTFKPGGATSPLEPALILPDLTDPAEIKKVWLDGKLPWVDKERHVMAGLLGPDSGLGINTSLVKPGEIKAWDDLLNPKWKGKILLLNPAQPGTKSDGHLMPFFYDYKGEDWVRRLAAQEPVLMADDRLATDWLAHGKYPIYIPLRVDTIIDFLKAGAPIGEVWTEDVMTLTAGACGISLIDKAPHPNAAKLFINWYLSKEGQTVMSKAYQSQSGRLDVPTDFLPPGRVRQPGAKFWFKDREEVLVKIADYRKKSQEIFGHLVK